MASEYRAYMAANQCEQIGLIFISFLANFSFKSSQKRSKARFVLNETELASSHHFVRGRKNRAYFFEMGWYSLGNPR